MQFKEEEDSDTILLSDLCSQLDQELIGCSNGNESRGSGDGGAVGMARPRGDLDGAAAGEDDFEDESADSYDWVDLAFALEEYLVYVHMSALTGGGGAGVAMPGATAQHKYTGDSSSGSLVLSPLAIKGYNVEVLLESIILANGDVYAASNIVFAVEEMIAAMKPCRHALGGHCGRSDCKFEHNLSCSPCRYWMSAQGCAQRGQSCPFSHSLQAVLTGAYDGAVFNADLGRLLEGAEGGGALSGYEYKENEFPALSGSATGPRCAAEPCTFGSGGGGGSKTINEELYQSIFKVSSYSYSKTGAPPSTAAATSGRNHSSSAVCYSGGRATASFVAEWVDSGRSVSYTYSQARQDARKMAVLRNGLFERARKSYLGNKREQARKLSSDGQLANLKMKECHRGAARIIFSAYNPEKNIRQGHFDLHGLHVSEALEILQELLVVMGAGDFSAETGVSHISVITGSGHHSVGGGGRLLQKVQQFFSDEGYSFALIRDDNKHTSGVRVRVS